MRKLTAFLICVLAVHARAATEIFASRGFKVGKCYRHFGKLTCPKKICNVTIFDGGQALVFGTNLTDPKSIQPPETRGEFSLRITQIAPEAKADFLKIREVGITEYLSAPAGLGLALPIPCPAK